MSSTYHLASVAEVFPAVTDWYTFSAGPPPESSTRLSSTMLVLGPG
jgi:hypothetical protein